MSMIARKFGVIGVLGLAFLMPAPVTAVAQQPPCPAKVTVDTPFGKKTENWSSYVFYKTFRNIQWPAKQA